MSPVSTSHGPTTNGFQATNDYVRGPGGEQLTETGSDGQGNMVWAHSNVYADGRLIATYNPDGLHFHLTDWVGTRRVETDYAGVAQQSCASLPYGDAANCVQGPTEQLYAGLERDDETGLDHALYRQYASTMGRWTSPDPYNGSYDLNNPQSLNRYAYVNGNPLGNVDPSGLAGAGVLTGVGGSACKILQGFNGIPIGDGLFINPCDPVESAISLGIAAYAASFEAGSIGSTLGIWASNGTATTASTLTQISAVVGAAITIGCSIDSNSDLCGQTSWTSALIGGDVGKVVGDSIAVAEAIACVSVPVAGCAADAIYTIANDLFSVFWDLFGPAQFKGSLQPRPSVPNQADILHTLGVPIDGANRDQQLHQKPKPQVPSPGMSFLQNTSF